MTAKATYTKLKDDSWGIRVPAQLNPKAGTPVQVTKASGEVKSEIIDRVLWTGKAKDGQEVSLCTIRHEILSSSNGSTQSAKRGDAETKRCWECGCRFNYVDAKRDGGDWSDSYCGC